MTAWRYVRFKNSLRSLTRTLSRDFERKIAKDLKVAPEKFWSHVKSRTNTRCTIPSLKRADGSLASSSEEKAETLNNFFSSVFTNEDLSTVARTIVQDYPFEGSSEFLGNSIFLQRSLAISF